MITKYDYFLLVAEELNITNAAKRAFVSQQYLSKYIASLEERYQVVLFNRKPTFSLTPEGQRMVERYQQLKALEVSLHTELSEMKDHPSTTLTFGASHGRALGILPYIYSDFSAKYPNVKIDCKSEMTHTMEKWILNGNLDLSIGVAMPESPLVTGIPIADENMYIAISDNLLKEYFPSEYPQCKQHFAQGVDLTWFESCPFLLSPTTSRTALRIYHYLEEHDIHLNSKIIISSTETQAELSRMGCGVSFCPKFLVPYVSSVSSNRPNASHLNLFPINGMEHTNQIVLMYHKDRYLPPYMKHFIMLIKQLFRDTI